MIAMGNFDDIMKVMLPSVYMGRKRVINGKLDGFGLQRSATRRHYGIDFNYRNSNGTRFGQKGINLEYPIMYAPVSGIVSGTKLKWGIVQITDEKGYRHQILHLKVKSWEEFRIFRKKEIKIGRAIGRMGNTGSKDYHGHYQIVVPDDFDKNMLKTEPDKYKFSTLTGQAYIDPELFTYEETTSAYRPGHFEKFIEWDTPPIVKNFRGGRELFCRDPLVKRSLHLDLEMPRMMIREY